MPDTTTSPGLRPVVRKVSSAGLTGSSSQQAPSHKELASRFERRPSADETEGGDFGGLSRSISGPNVLDRSTSSTSMISRAGRAGSIKGGTKTQRDQALENKVLNWIVSVINDTPSTDYEHYIQDGSILSKVMTHIVFNSVPMEDIDQTWGANPAFDRVNALIREIKRYGVVDVFEAETCWR